MQSYKKTLAIAFATITILNAKAQAQTGSNPIFRDMFNADPAPMVYDGKLYVYVGHDEAKDGEMFNMSEWLCYSTDDMINWTAHGSVMRPEDFKWDANDPNAVKNAWAAQTVYRNGKFYLYTTVTYGGRNIGVGVSDSPTGPFVDAIGAPLISDGMTNNGDPWDDIDPTVLIDDDGTAYLSWGNPNCYLAKLKPNMTELDGAIEMITPPYYGEGPWLSKREDMYYLTYAAFPVKGASEQICYATASNIHGPWTYQGILTGSAARSYTIHPGIINYKGNDYLFYHKADYTINGISGALGRRVACVEYLCYNDDGTMQPVTQTTAGVTVAPPCPSGYNPSIEFVSPQILSLVKPATVTFDVEASDEDGSIAHIDYFLNEETQTFHEEWTAPYDFEWEFAEAGEYTITAVAYDNDNNTGKDAITVIVNVPQAPYNGTAHAIPGKIELEEYDLGGNGFAYSDSSTDNTGGADFRIDEDVDIENCTDTNKGYNLGWTTAGEWIEYTVDVKTAGTYSITLRVASEGAGKTVSLAMDGTDIATNIEIPNTGGWQAWADVAIDSVQLSAGEQVLRLTIGNADYVNLNYITFTVQEEPIAISLKKGWNIIGYPSKKSASVETALSSIIDKLLFVKDNDGFYDANGDDKLNTLTQLKWGKGYFVKVNTDCELTW